MSHVAHITVPDGAPGIIGPMAAYPETEKHLNGLAEALLRAPAEHGYAKFDFSKIRGEWRAEGR
jgi:hypothetical protein